MATKNFAKMASKKLQALMETASEEDKKAIQEVLDAREQVKAEAAVAEEAQAEETTQELSPEEEAAIKAAEENGGINPMYAGGGKTEGSAKKAKMTNEELHALAVSVKENVGRKCQVVPFNTAEWVNGLIVGVVEEKRSGRVMYAVKTDDGRRIVKVHDSNLLRLLEERVTLERKKGRVAGSGKTEEEKQKWIEETMEIEIEKVIENVGRSCTFKRRSHEGETTYCGRIVSIVPDKRVQRLLYRINVPMPTEEMPDAAMQMYKVVGSQDLIIDEMDEEGKAFNEKYVARRDHATAKTPLSPETRVLKLEESLKKAEERMAKLQEEIEAKKKSLALAKAELDAYLASQQAGTSNAAEAATEEPSEEAADNANEDLA